MFSTGMKTEREKKRFRKRNQVEKRNRLELNCKVSSDFKELLLVLLRQTKKCLLQKTF